MKYQTWLLNRHTSSETNAIWARGAIQSATGYLPPEDTTKWPSGLVLAWNDMVESNPPVFQKEYISIGDLALAFLDYQRAQVLERMKED